MTTTLTGTCRRHFRSRQIGQTLVKICNDRTFRMPSLNGLCQITFTTCYIWTHPLRQLRSWPRASSQMLYCGHSTQYIHLLLC